MTVVQGTEVKVLFKLKSMGQVSSDLLEWRPSFRCPGDDSKVKRAAGDFDVLGGEEDGGFSGIG